VKTRRRVFGESGGGGWRRREKGRFGGRGGKIREVGGNREGG
jgi:hypothetical protein